MENKVTLEGEKLEHSYRQLEEMLEKAERMRMQMNTPVIISCFREFFEMRTALYQGEKEVWNMTPYEFSADFFWDSELKEVPNLPHILYVQTKAGKTGLLLMERTIRVSGRGISDFSVSGSDRNLQSPEKFISSRYFFVWSSDSVDECGAVWDR